VDLQNGGSFHSYVNVYQMVIYSINLYHILSWCIWITYHSPTWNVRPLVDSYSNPITIIYSVYSYRREVGTYLSPPKMDNETYQENRLTLEVVCRTCLWPRLQMKPFETESWICLKGGYHAITCIIGANDMFRYSEKILDRNFGSFLGVRLETMLALCKLIIFFKSK